MAISACGICTEYRPFFALQQFVQDVLERLWRYTEHENPRICAAAFAALAAFNQDQFSMEMLPSQVMSGKFVSTGKGEALSIFFSPLICI